MKFYRWKTVATAVRGKDHIETDKPCQDYVYSRRENGVVAIALSDGAGSKKASEIGAEIVTKKITELMVNHFDDFLMMTETIDDINNPFKRYAQLRAHLIGELTKELNAYIIKHGDMNFKDLASTLLFFAFKKDTYLMGHVGDGLIVGRMVEPGQDYLKVLSYPDNGAEANITFFMTNDDLEEHFKLFSGSISDLSGVILMSDGPEEVLFSPQDGIHPNTQSLFLNFHNVNATNYEKVLENLLQNEIAKFSYDDLSLNILMLDHIDVANDKVINQLEFFDQIHSKDQFIKASFDAYLIDELRPHSKRHFQETKDIESYIRGLL